MATYEYLCLSCEHAFEERRPMGDSGSVGTALACPSCGSERVRRRFSFMAPSSSGSIGSPSAGGCACGGGCGCGR